MWTIERVMSKVDASSGCWIWLGAFNTDGYPRMSERLPCGKYDQNIKGHRRAYELFKGEIPEGNVVRHSCDNITCVNPEHLILGTPTDNMRDRRDRSRTHKHISDEVNRRIIELRAQGLSQAKVAGIIGCSQAHISKLETGRYVYLEE